MKYIGSKVLETDHLILRPTCEDDLKVLWTILLDERVSRYYLVSKINEDWEIEKKWQYSKLSHALDKNVALPNDTWIDLFNGKIYSNGKVVHKDYSNIYEMPLFIRAGSLIPLVKEENRALKLDYSKLSLDYYPSLTNSDKQTLYEDDKETTAFKFGNFRTTEFTSNYDKNSNSRR